MCWKACLLFQDSSVPLTLQVFWKLHLTWKGNLEGELFYVFGTIFWLSLERVLNTVSLVMRMRSLCHSGALDQIHIIIISQSRGWVGSAKGRFHRPHIYTCCRKQTKYSISSCSITVLRDFVQFATGSRVMQGNIINVLIQQEDEYIVSHTCSREIIISTRIESFDAFKGAVLAVTRTSQWFNELCMLWTVNWSKYYYNRSVIDLW